MSTQLTTDIEAKAFVYDARGNKDIQTKIDADLAAWSALVITNYSLAYDTGSALFVVGEIVSGAVGVATVIGLAAGSDATSGTLYVDVTTSGFVPDETISGSGSGAASLVARNKATLAAPTKALIQGTGAATITAFTVASIAPAIAGYGYAGTEAVTIPAPTLANSTATITITETGGVIDTVTLEDGGFGYEDGGVAIAGGATGTVTITTVDGVITEIALLNAGTGYTAGTGVELDAPTLTVTQAVATINVTDTAIATFTVSTAGYGYESGVVITIAAPSLTISTGTVTIADTAGVLDSTVISAAGFGYEDGTTIAVLGGNADATVDITVVDGAITVATLNAAGTGYTVEDKEVAIFTVGSIQIATSQKFTTVLVTFSSSVQV